MPVKQNSFTHLRVLLVLTDRGIRKSIVDVALCVQYTTGEFKRV
jgi:hypothetical protein